MRTHTYTHTSNLRLRAYQERARTRRLAALALSVAAPAVVSRRESAQSFRETLEPKPTGQCQQPQYVDVVLFTGTLTHIDHIFSENTLQTCHLSFPGLLYRF